MNPVLFPARKQGAKSDMKWWGPPQSEVSKRGWQEGVGDKQPPKRAKNILQKCVPLLLRGHRKKVQKRGLNIWLFKDFLAPTPSVRQPLFETSDSNGSMFMCHEKVMCSVIFISLPLQKMHIHV